MDILNELVSLNALQHFIDTFKGQEGIVRVRTGDHGDDIRLLFVKNEHRYHYMSISSSQILKLSHTVPELQFRAPGYEKEETDYHADRVRAYVCSQGYYIWGTGYEHAEWVVFTYADRVDSDTVKHYNVPLDHIEMLLREPNYMQAGYKRKKGTS